MGMFFKGFKPSRDLRVVETGYSLASLKDDGFLPVGKQRVRVGDYPQMGSIDADIYEGTGTRLTPVCGYLTESDAEYYANHDVIYRLSNWFNERTGRSFIVKTISVDGLTVYVVYDEKW